MSADLTITLDMSGWKTFKATYPTMINRALDGAAEQILGDVVASFGTSVSSHQIGKLHLLKEVLGVKEILVWFDRDKAGSDAQHALVQALNADSLPARGFEWEQHFRSDLRGEVSIPEKIQDPCDLSTQQIQWLKLENVI